ncbi:DUF1127 domain-containing protein [Variovorax sp. EL159]|uniref:DUF1127 domain-containing protein n=1 Tax=Variovorax sp. EL159 TaxID=1566270 RepID=UPI00087E068F|nr:DUF1127 domain-containing protein [Variovorax sp. EL159]SCX56940.1 protein of unknown function [Variovorax sp. EL159]
MATLTLVVFRQWLLDALFDGARCIEKRRRLRVDASQLKAMSEHELCDLGVGRSEVPGLLRMAGAAPSVRP